MVNPLGRGNFGEVWLAHDNTLAKNVAVKVLYGKNELNQCLNEAKVGNFLSHDNLVKILYADIVNRDDKQFVFIAMDFHSKGAITNYLNSCNFLPLNRALQILKDVLRGLEYLHEKKFFHNDIKPQNILLGDAGHGILTDYGITSYSPLGESVHPQSAYKPHIAPEVISEDKISIQTDIYQFGLTAFRLINGIGTIREQYLRCSCDDEYNDLVVRGKLVNKNDYLPFVPVALQRIINKAISVNPSDRYQSAIEMRRALEKINYYGNWTTSDNGSYVGYDTNYEYRFIETNDGKSKCIFTCFKKNKKSMRETKISAYSLKNMTPKEMLKAKQTFMRDVVTGI